MKGRRTAALLFAFSDSGGSRAELTVIGRGRPAVRLRHRAIVEAAVEPVLVAADVLLHGHVEVAAGGRQRPGRGVVADGGFESSPPAGFSAAKVLRVTAGKNTYASDRITLLKDQWKGPLFVFVLSPVGAGATLVVEVLS